MTTHFPKTMTNKDKCKYKDNDYKQDKYKYTKMTKAKTKHRSQLVASQVTKRCQGVPGTKVTKTSVNNVIAVTDTTQL